MTKIAILGHQEVTKILSEKFIELGFEPVIISLSAAKGENISEYVHLGDYCEYRLLNFYELDDYSLKSDESAIFFNQSKFD